jgi:hypothetical protein
MSNLFYNGADILMSSGNAGTTTAQIQGIQSANIGYQIPRSNIPVLGRFKPLNQRPVINYTPVPVSFEFVKFNKDVEFNLGLLNPTGIAVQIAQSPMTLANYGMRDVEVKLCPNNSESYAGQYNLRSGVINSYSIGGSVGDPVKGAFAMEFLDLQQVVNTSARTVPNYSANIIKSENYTITGMNFSGFGYSGLILQSFKLDVNFSRTAAIRLGEKYPERRISEANATLSLQGFLEASSNAVTSLTQFDCGNFVTGNYSLSLLPSCSSEPATVINMTNPYLESNSLGIQVGNYISVDLMFSAPLSIIPSECSNGSNVTIT